MPHRVLLSDDDRAIRESLLRALDLEGYHVTEVPDGLSALATGRRAERDPVRARRAPGPDHDGGRRMARAPGRLDPARADPHRTRRHRAVGGDPGGPARAPRLVAPTEGSRVQADGTGRRTFLAPASTAVTIVLSVLAIAAAGAAGYDIYRIGDSGAQASWQGQFSTAPPPRGTGH